MSMNMNMCTGRLCTCTCMYIQCIYKSQCTCACIYIHMHRCVCFVYTYNVYIHVHSVMHVCRERAEDRHIAALKDELSHRHQKEERRRQVERLRLTREQEGRRDRENATRAPHQPPIIMVPLCTMYTGHVQQHIYSLHKNNYYTNIPLISRGKQEYIGWIDGSWMLW